jgi:tRNA uridine 5-carboxymethylaminomethyl modification enzyme
MFTSRAEHRLLLRADNAPERLTPIALEIGLLTSCGSLDSGLGSARRAMFAERRRQSDTLNAAIEETRLEGQPLARRLAAADFGIDDLRRALPQVQAADGVWRTVFADRLYAPYLDRQRAEIRRQVELEERRIPDWFDPALASGLRAESRAALLKFRPRTFGQAGRLEGVTPADLTLPAVLIKKGRATDREPAGVPKIPAS